LAILPYNAHFLPGMTPWILFFCVRYYYFYLDNTHFIFLVCVIIIGIVSIFVSVF